MSTYIDVLGRGYHRQYIVINEMEDDVIACKVCEDYDTAVGYAMNRIWEFEESYKDDGDKFEIGKLENNENSDSIRFRFKSHYWDHYCEEVYRILYYDEPDPSLDTEHYRKLTGRTQE